MAYTVKTLSKLSGVSVRALHFYEEMGLLTPSYYGSNGYRYYEEKELLRLQQILFFKELGFSLKQIQKVLEKGDFDQLAALYSHKNALRKQWEKTGKLLKTVDKTIEHIKGKRKMKEKEIFDGFHITLCKHTPGESCSTALEVVAGSVKNPTKNLEDVETRGKAHYDHIAETARALFLELVSCIEKGLEPKSNEVQKIIKKHHALAEETLDATKEVYKALAEAYENHPEFQKQLNPFHPRLGTFMAEGMRLFADQKLS